MIPGLTCRKEWFGASDCCGRRCDRQAHHGVVMGSNRKTRIWCPARPPGRALVELRERPDGVGLTRLLQCFSAWLQTRNDRRAVWLTAALSARSRAGSKLKVVDGGRIVPVDPSPCPGKGSIYLPWQANDKLRPHAFPAPYLALGKALPEQAPPIPRPFISLLDLLHWTSSRS